MIEYALAYARRRKQFGRLLDGFQLVQDQLVRMLSGVTSSMTLCHRLSQLEDEGKGSEEAASLAKACCAVSARQTVGLARELLGGNGILLEEQVGRFLADAWQGSARSSDGERVAAYCATTLRRIAPGSS